MPLGYANTTNVWPTWVQGTRPVTAGTTYTWVTWCQSTTTTTTPVHFTATNTAETWGGWIGQANAYTNVVTQVGSTGWEPRETTPEERADQERRTYVAKIRARSFEVRRRVANRAAKRLLLAHLREDQRREFEEHDYFHVETADGQRRYRIRTGTHGNVRRVRGDGVEDRSYCAQPSGIPTYDAMLAQALMLETDEAEFLRVANARVLA